MNGKVGLLLVLAVCAIYVGIPSCFIVSHYDTPKMSDCRLFKNGRVGVEGDSKPLRYDGYYTFYMPTEVKTMLSYWRFNQIGELAGDVRDSVLGETVLFNNEQSLDSNLNLYFKGCYYVKNDSIYFEYIYHQLEHNRHFHYDGNGTLSLNRDTIFIDKIVMRRYKHKVVEDVICTFHPFK